MMERAGPSSDGLFILNMVIGSSLSFVAFGGLFLLPGSSGQEDWDSETFVKELDQVSQKDPPLMNRFAEDKDWAEYITGIEPAYDERGFPEVTTIDPEYNFFSQKLNWTLTGRGEVPFLAIIYQFTDGETEGDQGAMWGVGKGHACGGVLVSPERLITNCQCVATYVADQIAPATITADSIVQADTKPAYPFDLGWRTSPGAYVFGGRVNRIYVQFGSNRYFTGNTMPGVKDRDNDRHLTNSLKETANDIARYTEGQPCTSTVKEVWQTGSTFRPPVLNPVLGRKLRDNLAFVPFHPPIKHPVPGQFVPWPPYEFNDQSSYVKQSDAVRRGLEFHPEQVVVTGIGFEKFAQPPHCRKQWVMLDDDGQEIPLHKQAVNLPYVHLFDPVREEETCRGRKLEEKLHKLSCFVDLYEQKTKGADSCKTLARGTLGWPIIYEGNVVALTASERNASVEGNRIQGSSLALQTFKSHVEDVLTVERIIAQRTERPPMFREDVAPEDIVFYDFPERPEWYVHQGTTPKMIPFSLSVRVSPLWTTSIVTPLVSLSTLLTSPWRV